MKNVTAGPVTGDDLFGRGDEIGNLWRSLDRGEHVLMLAPPGTGKTSLMRTLALDPRGRWDVVYADLEDCAGTADCVGAVLAGLASLPGFGPWAASIPFREPVRQAVREEGRAGADGAIARALSDHWLDAAEKLHAALRRTPRAAHRLLIILDEFPYMLARALQGPGGNREAERLGQWIQAMQDDPALSGWVSFLFGGSSALENVLRHMGLTRVDSRVAAFAVDGWTRTTADAFLSRLGMEDGFALNEKHRMALLDLLGDPLPQHVQMLYGQLRQTCGGDPARLADETLNAAFAQLATGPDYRFHFGYYLKRLEVTFRPRETGLVHYCLAQLCRAEDGLPLARVEPKTYGLERPFPVILRLLEEEGYLSRDRNTVRFRSNLLRAWWRKTQAPG